MIDVKELRIGNIVKDKDGKLLKVKRIYESATDCNDMEGKEWLAMDNAMHPIILTRSILKYCGFIDDKLTVGHLAFIWYGENNMGIHGMLGTIKPLSINYLHQLQNIIYTTTQTELKIEL